MHKGLNPYRRGIVEVMNNPDRLQGLRSDDPTLAAPSLVVNKAYSSL